MIYICLIFNYSENKAISFYEDFRCIRILVVIFLKSKTA